MLGIDLFCYVRLLTVDTCCFGAKCILVSHRTAVSFGGRQALYQKATGKLSSLSTSKYLSTASPAEIYPGAYVGTLARVATPTIHLPVLLPESGTCTCSQRPALLLPIASQVVAGGGRNHTVAKFILASQLLSCSARRTPFLFSSSITTLSQLCVSAQRTVV